MIKLSAIAPVSLMLVLLTGSATYGQTESKTDYGNSMTHGIQLESRRYSARVAEIKKKRIDVQTKTRNELLKCRGKRKCRDAVLEEHQDKMEELTIEASNEDATHQKNRVDIAQHWGAQDQWDTRGCTMPGGGGMPCKERGCADGNCKGK